MMKKLFGLLALVRFELPFAVGICVIMGQMLALGTFASPGAAALGFVSVFCLSASILVFNDVFDVETDRVNAPHRPIPSRRVTEREALLLALALTVAGLACSLPLGVVPLAISLFLLVIGMLYNRRYKKSGLPGNLMVSLSVGTTFIFGGISVGVSAHPVVWFFGLMVALIDLGEEIAADAMDMQGDALIHSRSLAIRYGARTALRISASIFFAVVLLSTVPFLLRWFTVLDTIPIAIMDAAIVIPTLKLLKSESEEGRKHIRQLYLGAIFGVVVFIALRLLSPAF